MEIIERILEVVYKIIKYLYIKILYRISQINSETFENEIENKFFDKYIDLFDEGN